MTTALIAQPVPVEVRETAYGFELLRDGKPYYVKGAGGINHLERLAESGANSVRTWGADLTEQVLDEAQRLGLTVCAGIWIEHERHDFDYDDPVAVAAQIEQCKRKVDQFKDHPALLLWGVGNEVETRSTNSKVWDTIEVVAAYIKKTDPHHPVMVVTAHILPATTEFIKSRCPSIDLLGSNSYAGLPVIGRDIRRSGWSGAYLITEWGPNGTWEVDKTPWGAEPEPTSTEKARMYAERYGIILGDKAHCLGSYVFLWGQKQEVTPTWFNLYTESGAETEGVEVLQTMWTGKKPAITAPRITPLKLNGAHANKGLRVHPGKPLVAEFEVTRGEMAELRMQWELMPESQNKGHGGDAEIRPANLPLPKPCAEADQTRFTFSAPKKPGAYRIYLTVFGPGNKAATANFPFHVGAVSP